MQTLRKTALVLALLLVKYVQGQQSRRFNPLVNKFAELDTCDCGRLNTGTDKIVGGKLTKINQYPWMVSLHRTSVMMFSGLKSSQLCGGALISPEWVLTAAHCTYAYLGTPFLLTINLGDYDLTLQNETANVQRVASSIVIHPDYNNVRFDSDIALIRMDRAIDSSVWRTIRPICLPPSSDFDPEKNQPPQQVATALGWGSTKEGGRGSGTLFEVTVPILSNEQCIEKYNNSGVRITPKMMCAGYPEGGRDTCQGDSGGPLQYQCGNLNDGYIIIGVVSFGIGCARPGFPGVYARVSQFVAWIKEKTQLEFCTKECFPLSS